MNSSIHAVSSRRLNVREAGLPRIRLHDVRHSYATASLRAGVPLKVVSERIGHVKTSITGDPYQRALPELDEEAASVIAAVIDQAAEQREDREQAGGGHP
jgi:integrase